MTPLEKLLHDKFKHTKFWKSYKTSRLPRIRRMLLKQFLRELGLIGSYYSTMSFKEFRKCYRYEALLQYRSSPTQEN